jgi:hypothetical protein
MKHALVVFGFLLASSQCIAMMQEENEQLLKAKKPSRVCCSMLADLCELLQFYNPQQIAPHSPRMQEIMIGGNNDSFRIKLIPQAKK